VGQAGHSEAGVSDTQAGLFLSHNRCRGIDRLPLAFCGCHCSGSFNPVLGYEAVNITHSLIMAQAAALACLDFTDAG
jgi:hypothetical protein